MDKSIKLLVKEYNISEKEAIQIIENTDNVIKLMFKKYFNNPEKWKKSSLNS